MRRREVIALIGSAVASPLAGQQLARLPTIGFLGGQSPSAMTDLVAQFTQRLAELGWIEGRNIAIEYRWAEGRNERAAEIAAEFVRLKVDLIVTAGTANVVAAKAATKVIPIIFAAAGDPVGSGLVASLARPGGNVTGLSNQSTDLAGKQIEFLREMLPDLRRLAILANVGSQIGVLDMREVLAGAGPLGVTVVPMEVRRVDDIAPAFAALNGRADALFVAADPLMNTNRVRINNLAVEARLPTMHGFREPVAAGGLMSYGPSFPHLYRRGADFADKVLRGAKPADIPIEQPTKFELVINLRTARTLSLTIPPTLLARADEVIE
jgi:putative ABC transport system substrate-binding protein